MSGMQETSIDNKNYITLSHYNKFKWKIAKRSKKLKYKIGYTTNSKDTSLTESPMTPSRKNTQVYIILDVTTAQNFISVNQVDLAKHDTTNL